MNKKVFIGATLITATVVGGLVYYRHVLLDRIGRTLESLDRLLDHEDPEEVPDVFPEAKPMTAEEAAEFEAALKREQPF